MKIDREHLLQCLNQLTPGLTTKNEIEQSSCIIALNGELITFNGAVACRIKTPFEKIQGAIPAKQLKEIAHRVTDKELSIKSTDASLIIRGKNRQTTIHMQAEIQPHIHTLEKPDSWTKLHPKFADALSLAILAATKSAKAPYLFTCIHLHPEKMESCDRYQAMHIKIQTGLPLPVLVRKEDIENLHQLGVDRFNLSTDWIHFKNPNGLIYSCRVDPSKYIDLQKIFKQKDPQKVLFPNGLEEAINNASIFAKDNNDNAILVKLQKDKICIIGEGPAGKHEERRTIQFDSALSFRIAPKLLVEITKKSLRVNISRDKLTLKMGPVRYITALGIS